MVQAIAMENLAKSHEEANALIERTTSRAAVGRAKGSICMWPAKLLEIIILKCQ